MHIDVTPSIRLPNPPERESVICHAKPGEPTQHGFVDMNAFGFGQWYCSRTPTEERFAKAFNRRLYEAAGLTFAADADVHDVPEQTPLLVKSATTVAHQLLKRFRNILYAQAPGRIPPSVVLACHAGEAAAPGMPLTEMVNPPGPLEPPRRSTRRRGPGGCWTCVTRSGRGTSSRTAGRRATPSRPSSPGACTR